MKGKSVLILNIPSIVIYSYSTSPTPQADVSLDSRQSLKHDISGPATCETGKKNNYGCCNKGRKGYGDDDDDDNEEEEEEENLPANAGGPTVRYRKYKLRAICTGPDQA